MLPRPPTVTVNSAEEMGRKRERRARHIDVYLDVIDNVGCDSNLPSSAVVTWSYYMKTVTEKNIFICRGYTSQHFISLAVGDASMPIDLHI